MSDLRRAVARVRGPSQGDPDGAVALGTGFLVCPDLLVACSPLPEGLAGHGELTVGFPGVPGNAPVAGHLLCLLGPRSGAGRVAFVRLVSSPHGAPVLGLRSRIGPGTGPDGGPGSDGSRLRGFGYPPQGPRRRGSPSRSCSPRPPTRRRTFSVCGAPRTRRGGARPEDLCGSPLVDDDGLVLGVLTGRSGDGTLPAPGPETEAARDRPPPGTC